MRTYQKNLTKSITKTSNALVSVVPYAQKMAAEVTSTTTKNVTITSDHFLSELIKLPFRQARPQLKKSTTIAERKAYGRQQRDESARKKYKAASTEGWLVLRKTDTNLIWVTSIDAYDAYINNGWGRLFFVACLRKMHKAKDKTAFTVTWDDILDPKEYAAKNKYRAISQVKKYFQQGGVAPLLQAFRRNWGSCAYTYNATLLEDGKGLDIALKTEKTASCGQPKLGHYQIPLCVYESTNKHAIPVWLVLWEQQGNKMIKMETLEDCYINGGDPHTHVHKTKLITLLQWLETEGCLEIKSIANPRMAAKNKHDTRDGDDYLDPYKRRTSLYYMEYRILTR